VVRLLWVVVPQPCGLVCSACTAQHASQQLGQLAVRLPALRGQCGVHACTFRCTLLATIVGDCKYLHARCGLLLWYIWGLLVLLRYAECDQRHHRSTQQVVAQDVPGLRGNSCLFGTQLRNCLSHIRTVPHFVSRSKWLPPAQTTHKATARVPGAIHLSFHNPHSKSNCHAMAQKTDLPVCSSATSSRSFEYSSPYLHSSSVI
jgi:hypothetical protein